MGLVILLKEKVCTWNKLRTYHLFVLFVYNIYTASSAEAICTKFIPCIERGSRGKHRADHIFVLYERSLFYGLNGRKLY